MVTLAQHNQSQQHLQVVPSLESKQLAALYDLELADQFIWELALVDHPTDLHTNTKDIADQFMWELASKGKTAPLTL